MKHLTFKVLMAKQRVCNRVQSLLQDKQGGDDWFTMALKIVITFVIAALVIALMVILFGDTAIGGWLKKTTTSWFPSTGELRP